MAVRSLTQARKRIESLQSSTKRARAKAGETMEAALGMAEVAGTAFAVGFLEGRITDPKQFELFGVPIPLAAGISAHLFAILGVGRGMESHLRNVGNGALAAHVNGLGRKLGADAKTTGVSGSNQLGPASSTGLGITEEDLIDAAL